jgi:hypothetical protein
LKADRSILQRLITAYEAGRHVNLSEILCHELLPVPISLAETNGSLRTRDKSILTNVLISNIPTPPSLDNSMLGTDATLIIDGQALVQSLGKPKGLTTFGHLGDAFKTAALQGSALFKRIDIVFDRYYPSSIKAGKRKKRAQGTTPIRRVIEHRNVPLPSNWNNFIALSDNKADLARFLSEQLIILAPDDKIIVVAGGFNQEEMVASSDHDVDTKRLEAKHEEGDTRIILHCMEIDSDVIVVQARDTDVFILLLANFHWMPCRQLWIKAGTMKRRRYIPIHSLIDNLPYGPTVLETLPAFHVLTGCDTTSHISGHSTKSAWEVFKSHHKLLQNLGKGELVQETAQDAESFVCKMYKISHVATADEARAILFVKSRAPESLPPTSDSLSFHIKRAHYQTSVWRQAHLQYPRLAPPDSLGWKYEEGHLVPQLMSLTPVPESCLELVSCDCTVWCQCLRCKCKKSQLPCTAMCMCKDIYDMCHNF